MINCQLFRQAMFNLRKEKLYIILFYAVLTIVLTWPFASRFFSSVPSLGSDTMQVIGVAGERANVIKDLGFWKGTFELLKRSEFNVVTLYSYFELIFGRIAGYNLLFFASFVLSGFGMYLLAFYFTKNKPASLIAGIIFAFSPFHVHNSLSTNVGTMHQEWLPFFALYLFKFFDSAKGSDSGSKETDNSLPGGQALPGGNGSLRLKNFLLAGLFLGLIAFTEHQLLAFTLIFILFFLVYKIFTQPKIFIKGKLWLYVIVSVAILSAVSFLMFRSLFEIAFSGNNYLDPGFKAAVKYSNDALAIIIPPSFHSFWPDAFSHIRETFRRRTDSSFSIYAGFSVLLLSILGMAGMRSLRKRRIPTRGIWFWFATALGFYILSLGPHLNYMGEINPPVKMPYLLAYNYLPFFNNIRTVGRLFIYSILSFSILAAWGSAYLISKASPKNEEEKEKLAKDDNAKERRTDLFGVNLKQQIIVSLISLVVIVEYLAVPFKTNTLLHSSFYDKLGQDKENYSVLEIPGSTNYDFASRDLVWKSIHRKNTVNSYDFAREIDENDVFQKGTPIVRTLLYDISNEDSGNDRDIMKNSYYNISSEILNYYSIRYVILDKEGLKGNPEKGDLNMLYPAKAYISNVIKCADEYEDEYLYACRIDQTDVPDHMFLAMDYSNKHWVGKSKSKNGIQRWAENGAGVKLVNMTNQIQSSKLNFDAKISKPLRLKVFFNGAEIYNQYLTYLGKKQTISADLPSINPGENDVTFGVYAADGTEIKTDKKSDSVVIYQVEVE
ncbi:MAG: hypothetical protein WC831_00270 [Parcubacteria group bacterium]|jgi:hypothetical protein